MHASGIGLEACFLQVRDGTQFAKNEVPDYEALHPITFATKSLTSAEIRYCNI